MQRTVHVDIHNGIESSVVPLTIALLSQHNAQFFATVKVDKNLIRTRVIELNRVFIALA